MSRPIPFDSPNPPTITMSDLTSNPRLVLDRCLSAERSCCWSGRDLETPSSGDGAAGAGIPSRSPAAYGQNPPTHRQAVLEPVGRLGWMKLGIGLFVAAQTMMLGLAINLTPVEDQQSRAWLMLGMASATALVAILLGWPLARDAVRAAIRGRVTIEALFVAGLVGSAGISVHAMVTGEGQVYFDVVCILLIVYALGRAIRRGGEHRAAGALAKLLADLDRARKVTDTANPETDRLVRAGSLAAGELIRILPGELITLSGRVMYGSAMVSRSAFTGEWLPRVVEPGAMVEAGEVSEDGELIIAVSGPGSRTLDAFLQMVEQARQHPARHAMLADRFVRLFLPVVLLTAGGATAWGVWHHDLQEGLFRGLAVLLVACPCAAGLATPLVVWNLLGQLARRGLLLHGGRAVERLSEINEAAFDKTGTLGDRTWAVAWWQWLTDPNGRRPTIASPSMPRASDDHPAHEDPDRIDEQYRLLAAMLRLEQASEHPVASALRPELERMLDIIEQAYPERIGSRPQWRINSMEHLPGRGVQGRLTDPATDEQIELAFLRDIDEIKMQAESTSAPSGSELLTLVIEAAGRPVARAALRESLRPTSSHAIEAFRRLNIPVTVLTGDGEAGATLTDPLAPTLATMTGEEKALWLAGEVGRKQRDTREAADTVGHSPRRVLMVGDGINDAAALEQAHVGIAMGDGSALAMESADGVLLNGNIQLIPMAVEWSGKAMSRIRSNLAWAVSYNMAGMILAATGLLHPIAAVLLMACSSALVCRRSFTWLKADEAEGAERLKTGDIATADREITAVEVTASSSPVDEQQTEDAPDDQPPAVAGQGERDGVSDLQPGTTALEQGWTPAHRTVDAVHGVGWIGLAWVLGVISGLDPAGVLMLMVAAVPVWWLTVRWGPWLDSGMDMTLGMLSVGGLGMMLGWWWDIRMLESSGGVTGDACICCISSSPGEWAAWLNGMNVGMLALGVPAMYVVRYHRQPWRWRSWCCSGMLVFGIPGMLIGMMVGGSVAITLLPLEGPARIIAHGIGMLAGMGVGMLLPHYLGLLVWPDDRYPEPSSEQARSEPMNAD